MNEWIDADWEDVKFSSATLLHLVQAFVRDVQRAGCEFTPKDVLRKLGPMEDALSRCVAAAELSSSAEDEETGVDRGPSTG